MHIDATVHPLSYHVVEIVKMTTFIHFEANMNILLLRVEVVFDGTSFNLSAIN